MCIKKLFFTGILVIFSTAFLDAADYPNRQFLTSSTDDDIQNLAPRSYGSEYLKTSTDSIDVGLLEQEISSIKIIPIDQYKISNPDDIYEKILESSETLVGTTFILDVDGTLTNEPDPQTLKQKQQVTPRGNVVNNIRALIKKGATVIFCSAWNKIEETVNRLRQIGFNNEDLGIEDVFFKPVYGRKEISLSSYQAIPLKYMQQGRVISTKIDSFVHYGDIYYRNKAFSPFLYASFNIDTVKSIYFFDDSGGNLNNFIRDIRTYNPYPDKTITTYYIMD